MRLKLIYGIILGLMFMWIIPAVHAEGEFQLSYSCTSCHQERYNEWSRSMHALAVNDPIFEAAYLRAYQSDPKYRNFCLTCHSPTTRITNDFNLTKSISVEGITCSFCHSVTGVENNNFTFNPNNPMQGPYNDSKTDAHASAYSALHTKSEFCAGCHEFSINGVPISDTYSEWKEGPYAAEGKQCQDCHMETKSGAAAENGTIRDKVYQHFWYGGHTGQFLQNAFQIESSMQRTGNRVKVTINITNNNVGHMIPSGLPSRKVVLDFKASDEQGREIFSDQKVYAKTLVDQYGNEVADFWKAVSIAKDNRFKPKESRLEVFEFDVPDGTGKLDTQATLTYQLQAEIITTETESVNVELAKVSNTTTFNMAAQATPKGTPALGWVGILIAMTAAVLVIRRKR
ncbi:MAG: multiheme c-type cytochrome [Candidatus Methanoperedens sp.]|nr:multiheme c-type cytochrome [Candidatus Methanoperedens sp.]MCZ7396155.1 multiheme c-type cytochrome [Candidatus Methanoperedens sp.]